MNPSPGLSPSRAFLLAILAASAASAFAQDLLRAPGGAYADRASLMGDAGSVVRSRQDFLLRASGCPLYIVTLPSAAGAAPRDKAAELFTRWHAADKRLPDEAMLLVVFAAEKTGALILGPTVPKEYEEALADLPPLQWGGEAGASGKAIDRLVFDIDAKLEAPGIALKRRRAYYIPPVPRTFVLDGDDRFTEAEHARMERELAALAKSSGHTILAVIDPPGLTYSLGAFESVSIDRWTDEAFAQWRRDRPELENGAVLFAFSSTFGGAIAYGKNVEGKLPKDVSQDLVKEMADGQTRPNFSRAIVRVADTVDARFAGKMTVSTRSNWWYVLHPWRVFAGPDEETPLWFEIASLAFILYLLGWALWLVITNPKMVLGVIIGSVAGGLIGGVVSQFAGEAVGNVAGKFVGGFGSSGGGGSSGSW